MRTDKIKWDVVKQLSEKYGDLSATFYYGMPSVTDPINTIIATDDVIVQPKWDIPDKVIISTTVCGSFYGKKANPNHPVGMDEIYQSAREICLAGAPVVHLHVRNDEGYNRLDPERFKRIVYPLKDEFPDVMFDFCLVPRYEGDWERLREMLESGIVEITPINTAAAYCGDMLLTKAPHVIVQKARMVQEYGVIPRVAVYTDGDIDNADRWLFKTGLIDTGATGRPSYWGVLPALPGGSPMNNPDQVAEGLLHLTNRIKTIDKDAIIQVCSSGRASSYLAAQAIMLGHHVRIGMEDTIWRWPHKDEMLKSNAQTFLEFKELAHILGREVATANEYRQMIGLPPR